VAGHRNKRPSSGCRRHHHQLIPLATVPFDCRVVVVVISFVRNAEFDFSRHTRMIRHIRRPPSSYPREWMFVCAGQMQQPCDNDHSQDARGIK
jgi:hypothetical protein